MDNPETLATLGTQDTELRQTKHKNTTRKPFAVNECTVDSRCLELV